MNPPLRHSRRQARSGVPNRRPTPGTPTLIPLPFARGSRAMRLVVREYEARVADAPESGDPLQVSRDVERLIYADMITA